MLLLKPRATNIVAAVVADLRSTSKNEFCFGSIWDYDSKRSRFPGPPRLASAVQGAGTVQTQTKYFDSSGQGGRLYGCSV